MIDLNEILTNVFLVVANLGLAAIIKFGGGWLRANSKDKKLQVVEKIAREAVRFAEEMGYTLDITGDEKLARATGFFQDTAKRLGIRVSDAQAQSFILGSLTDFRTEIAAIFREEPEYVDTIPFTEEHDAAGVREEWIEEDDITVDREERI